MVETSKYCPTTSENSNNLKLMFSHSPNGLEGWIIILRLLLLEIFSDNFSTTSSNDFIFVDGNITTLQYTHIDFDINKFSDLISFSKILLSKSLLKCSDNLISNETISNFSIKSIFSGNVPLVSSIIFKFNFFDTSEINSGYSEGSPPVNDTVLQSGVMIYSISLHTSSTDISFPDDSDLLFLVSQ